LLDFRAAASVEAEAECAAFGAPLLPLILAEPKMSSSESPPAFAAAPWSVLASFFSPPNLPPACSYGTRVAP